MKTVWLLLAVLVTGCACHAKPVHNQPVCTTNDQHITLCLQPGAAK